MFRTGNRYVRVAGVECAVSVLLDGSSPRFAEGFAYLGISTVSMAWITPLSATTSAATTLASFPFTRPTVLTLRSAPFSVVAV